MPGIGVTASRVLNMPYSIQGCRPTSVTIHPASTAKNPNGVISTNNFSSHLVSTRFRFLAKI